MFLATGFWHGAGFNFIVWGLWHGLFLIIERAPGINKRESGAPAPLRWLATMLAVAVGRPPRQRGRGSRIHYSVFKTL